MRRRRVHVGRWPQKTKGKAPHKEEKKVKRTKNKLAGDQIDKSGDVNKAEPGHKKGARVAHNVASIKDNKFKI